VERVRKLLEAKPRADGLCWVTRTEDDDGLHAATERLLHKEEDRRWQIRIRARLGGERRLDLARACGYSAGSANTQILERLERAVLSNSAIRTRLSALEAEHENLVSGITTWMRLTDEPHKRRKVSPINPRFLALAERLAITENDWRMFNGF
jgi:hypothetical protein